MARWSLFVAAMLQFGAAAVGPYWHLAPLAVRSSVLQQPRGEEDPGAPASHHSEQACLVCQSLAGIGVPPSQSVLFFSPVAELREVPEHSTVLRPVARSSTLARAPPHA